MWLGREWVPWNVYDILTFGPLLVGIALLTYSADAHTDRFAGRVRYLALVRPQRVPWAYGVAFSGRIITRPLGGRLDS